MNVIAQTEVKEAPVDLGISVDPTIVKTGRLCSSAFCRYAIHG